MQDKISCFQKVVLVLSMQDVKENCEVTHVIDSKANLLTHVNSDIRKIVKNTLIQHKHIFSGIPGRITGYEYRTKVRNSKKLVRRLSIF